MCEKISIITPTFNSEHNIVRCMDSLAMQSFANYEHIIMDGESLDATEKVVKERSNKNTIFISQKDKGIYDALNQGILRTQGDVIGWLNSDDIYANPDVLKNIMNIFLTTPVDVVFGDLKYIRGWNSEAVLRNWISGPYSERKVRLGWMPPTPTVFYRRSSLNMSELYDINYEISGDYDFFLRHRKLFSKSHYLNTTLVLMSTGGVSNRNWYAHIKRLREDRRALNNQLMFPTLTLLAKNLRKIKQFF